MILTEDDLKETGLTRRELDQILKNQEDVKTLERLKTLVKSEIQNGHKRIPTSILYNILEKK